MFDNLSKFLADEYSENFSSWFVGYPVTLTELKPKELSLEPIRVAKEVAQKIVQKIAQNTEMIALNLLRQGEATGFTIAQLQALQAQL
jgi:hypothetical protein